MSSDMANSTAFVFPGQGSQAVGMGLDVCEAFPVAAAVFEAADRALGFELSRLCWQGPEEELETLQLEGIQLEALSKAMENLDERSKNIVNKRWLSEKKQTLHQLADEYGVSAERIRQLEKSAFKKMAESIST